MATHAHTTPRLLPATTRPNDTALLRSGHRLVAAGGPITQAVRTMRAAVPQSPADLAILAIEIGLDAHFADPIHAAIERHRTAYDAFQVAPEGKVSKDAEAAYDAASEVLTATACTTRYGALAFLAHLRWWLCEEAEFADGHQPAYGIAQARAADLTLFLGTRPSALEVSYRRSFTPALAVAEGSR